MQIPDFSDDELFDLVYYGKHIDYPGWRVSNDVEVDNHRWFTNTVHVLWHENNPDIGYKIVLASPKLEYDTTEINLYKNSVYNIVVSTIWKKVD